MRRLLLLVLACAPSGCDVVFHIDPITAGSNQVLDAEPPTAEGIDPVCSLVGQYGGAAKGLISYCVHTGLPPRDLAGKLDTTANPMCDYVASAGANMAPVCVVAAQTIAVTGKLTVLGDKPLVLAAYDTISITGEIEATGGGADPITCTTGKGSTGTSSASGGGGGGGGGSWQTRGGKGGAGKSGTAANGGVPALDTVEIRGGCAGGAGGSGIGGSGGMGGAGGGAIYLTARTAIHVGASGVINASGLGGPGGNAPDGGAGGGGSGGMIAFDSPVVTFDFDGSPGAKVFANGGGGGAGGSGAGSVSTDPATAAAGALPNGGTGAIAINPGGLGGAGSTTGGGGGGGGQGFIVVYTHGPVAGDANHVSPPILVGS